VEEHSHAFREGGRGRLEVMFACAPTSKQISKAEAFSEVMIVDSASVEFSFQDG